MVFQCGFSFYSFYYEYGQYLLICFGTIFISLFVNCLCFCPFCLPNFRTSLKLELGVLYPWYSHKYFLPVLFPLDFELQQEFFFSPLKLKWSLHMCSSSAYVVSVSWLWYSFCSPFFSSEDSWPFCQVKKVLKIFYSEIFVVFIRMFHSEDWIHHAAGNTRELISSLQSLKKTVCFTPQFLNP